jgi:hypothetical protein
VELDGRIGHEAEGRFRDMERDNATTVDRLDGLRYGWGRVFGRGVRHGRPGGADPQRQRVARAAPKVRACTLP